MIWSARAESLRLTSSPVFKYFWTQFGPNSSLQAKYLQIWILTLFVPGKIKTEVNFAWPASTPIHLIFLLCWYRGLNKTLQKKLTGLCNFYVLFQEFLQEKEVNNQSLASFAECQDIQWTVLCHLNISLTCVLTSRVFSLICSHKCIC